MYSCPDYEHRCIRDMFALPLLCAPHRNDCPSCDPSVKALKLTGDTTPASMQAGSAGCHRL